MIVHILQVYVDYPFDRAYSNLEISRHHSSDFNLLGTCLSLGAGQCSADVLALVRVQFGFGRQLPTLDSFDLLIGQLLGFRVPHTSEPRSSPKVGLVDSRAFAPGRPQWGNDLVTCQKAANLFFDKTALWHACQIDGLNHHYEGSVDLEQVNNFNIKMIVLISRSR